MERDFSARSRGRRRITSWPSVLVLAVVAVAGSGGSSIAAFSSVDAHQVTATVQVLDPPPNVTCSGALVVCTAGLISRPQLSWSPTPDLYATGYEVWRSTTNGSGYVQVGTVAGRTTTAWTDTGTLSMLTTYYYVVRATSATWTSAFSNQVAVTIASGG